MTLLLTLQPDRPMEIPTAVKTTSTQLFEVLYITFTAPILWWALPSGPAVFRPKPTNASNYAWIPDSKLGLCQIVKKPGIGRGIGGLGWGVAKPMDKAHHRMGANLIM
ncbi:hypothetical protein DSO57_1022105 [Entomophthora muscae]|uniref:Uncharacterized protein n=1 Tax=Entomophthora muscae TaxID=34485 RepID=A0ACC2T3F0_9FUNG|nr:hypothetical protein DSO57_1022105 [Entomophthora muscae]